MIHGNRREAVRVLADYFTQGQPIARIGLAIVVSEVARILVPDRTASRSGAHDADNAATVTDVGDHVFARLLDRSHSQGLGIDPVDRDSLFRRTDVAAGVVIGQVHPGHQYGVVLIRQPIDDVAAAELYSPRERVLLGTEQLHLTAVGIDRYQASGLQR